MTEQPEPTPKAPSIPDEMTDLIIHLTDICEVFEKAMSKHEKYYRDALEYRDHVKRASRDLDLLREAANETGQGRLQFYEELQQRQREASDKPRKVDGFVF